MNNIEKQQRLQINWNKNIKKYQINFNIIKISHKILRI